MRITLPSRLGFGTAPLGNMYRDIPHEEALATVDAAWDSGIRYFDAAPLYGAGLAELRLGEALAGARATRIRSAPVGRLVLDEHEDASQRDLGEKGGLFRHGLPNRIVYDYTEDGTLRSIDASLKRLRTDRLDTVWIHDPAVDFHGDAWRDVFDVAMSGGRALTRLRDESDPGLGPRREPRRAVRTRARTRGPRRFPARRTLHAARPCRRARTADAGKRRARPGSSSAARTTRACWRAARITVSAGHAGHARPRRCIRRICERFGVDVRAVALQFSLAHPASRPRSPARAGDRIDDNLRLAAMSIPAELWDVLKAERLIAAQAPTPVGPV